MNCIRSQHKIRPAIIDTVKAKETKVRCLFALSVRCRRWLVWPIGQWFLSKAQSNPIRRVESTSSWSADGHKQSTVNLSVTSHRKIPFVAQEEHHVSYSERVR